MTATGNDPHRLGPCRTLLRRGAALALSALVMVAAARAAPGQTRGSKDAVAIASAAAAALQADRHEEALEGFERAAALLPRDASLRVGAGIAALALNRLEDAERWLTAALALDPRQAVAAYHLGEALYRQGRVPEAIATYEQALAGAAPDLRPALERSLTMWREDVRRHAGFLETPGAHFSVLFEGPANQAAARRVVEILEREYWRIGRALNTYPAHPITVVLYSREQFRDLAGAPDWAAGVYDGRIRLPVRGALEDPDGLERVLAHELVHAMVAGLGGGAVPAWLHEGLARYFEPGGIEAARQRLANDRTRVPWERLERPFTDLPHEEAAAAYAQSAVAVKRMIDLRGTYAVVAILQALSRGVPFGTAFHQAMALPLEEFAAAVMRQ